MNTDTIMYAYSGLKSNLDTVKLYLSKNCVADSLYG